MSADALFSFCNPQGSGLWYAAFDKCHDVEPDCLQFVLFRLELLSGLSCSDCKVLLRKSADRITSCWLNKV
ncbi:MAG: hypothetical protein U5R30_09510 [Deltaproteobacteria bacterium]|nr:hypothetical protein [Deltaproteobacteria bacterium]